MTKTKVLISKLAAGTAFFLSAILFVGANTVSSRRVRTGNVPWGHPFDWLESV